MHERPSAAATDVGEFLTDLEGGQFDSALSAALSEVAASVVDRGKKGKVRVDFTFQAIKGTHQVDVAHTVTFTRPTLTGKRSEDHSGATVLHVGKGGRLSLTQPDLFDEKQRHGNLPV